MVIRLSSAHMQSHLLRLDSCLFWEGSLSRHPAEPAGSAVPLLFLLLIISDIRNIQMQYWVLCALCKKIRFPRLCVDKHDCTDSEHWFKNIQHLQDEHENQLWPSPNCSRDVPEMISCDTHSNCFICFMLYLLLVKGIKIQYIDDILPVIHCTVTQPDLSGLLH